MTQLLPMGQICFSVLSEGGHTPTGVVYSANTGSSSKSTNSTPLSLVVIRLKSTVNNLKVNVVPIGASVVATTAANGLVSIYKISDQLATAVLTGSSFVSAGTNSSVEYDVSSSAITLTNAELIESSYFSSDVDTVSLSNLSVATNSVLTSNNSGVSDLLCLVVQSIGGNETYSGGITWKEFI